MEHGTACDLDKNSGSGMGFRMSPERGRVRERGEARRGEAKSRPASIVSGLLQRTDPTTCAEDCGRKLSLTADGWVDGWIFWGANRRQLVIEHCLSLSQLRLHLVITTGIGLVSETDSRLIVLPR